MQNLWSKIIKILKRKNGLSQFLILISFLFTFVIVRIITHLQKAHILPDQSGTLHIHHMVPGIILLLLSGFIGISFWHKEKLRYITATAFGIGAALTLDEFSLWLFLQNVYWAKQGRDSVDAIITVTILLIISLLFTEIDIIKYFKQKNRK